MSGILGIWNTDGAPVSAEILRRMNDRLAHRGPDGSQHLVSGSAGFAYQQLRVTPESFQEVQPLRSSSGAVMLFDGRLDNRDELLGLLPGLPPASPDVDLAMAAYASLGEDFVSRLDGDFVLAVYDPVRHRLLLARDAIGARALNYARTGGTILFASEAKALLAHPSMRTAPDEASLAEFLYRHWDYRDETNTYFAGISRVPAGRCVVFTPERTEIRRHFDFDTGKTLRLRSQQDYVEAYREAFFRAVGNRLRSHYPSAISVSGGLDSTSIFCTAAHLRRTGKLSHPFFGIGIVGSDVRGNELPFQQAAQQQADAELVLIPAEHMGISRDRQLKMWHAESPLLINDAWQDLYAEARRRNARVYLSGFFGDHLLMSSHHIIDLIRHGRWIRALRHLRAYYSNRWYAIDEFPASKAMLTRELYFNLRTYVMPEVFRPAYQWLRRRSRARVPKGFYSERFQQVGWRRQLNNRTLRLPSAKVHRKALYGFVHSKAYKNRMEMDTRAIGMFQMEMDYPFYDRNLIQLVMSMPGEMVYPNGESRGIHRAAMAGILPEAIRVRRSKGDFTRLGRLGGLKDFAVVESLLYNGKAQQLGFMKPPEVLRQDLLSLRNELGDETDSSAFAFWQTADLLELETFLEVFFDPSKNACYPDAPQKTC